MTMGSAMAVTSPQVSAECLVQIIHFRLCKQSRDIVALVTGAVSALDNLLEELGTWGQDIKEHMDMDTVDKKGDLDLEDQLDDLTEKLKTALETGRTFATLFSEMDLR